MAGWGLPRHPGDGSHRRKGMVAVGVTRATFKGHGITVGDRFMWHGSTTTALAYGAVAVLNSSGKSWLVVQPDTGDILATVGYSAKVWATEVPATPVAVVKPCSCGCGQSTQEGDPRDPDQQDNDPESDERRAENLRKLGEWSARQAEGAKREASTHPFSYARGGNGDLCYKCGHHKTIHVETVEADRTSVELHGVTLDGSPIVHLWMRATTGLNGSGRRFTTRCGRGNEGNTDRKSVV